MFIGCIELLLKHSLLGRPRRTEYLDKLPTCIPCVHLWHHHSTLVSE
jgi:hypothetical protein